MFSIDDLSNEENRLVREAPEQFGQFFKLTKDTIDYSWDFISSLDLNAYVFNAFLTQANKSLSLALLSIIRYHNVQSHQLIRNAIESIALACYALDNPNQDNFVILDESKKILLDKPKVKVKAYKWLNEHYPKHSGHLNMVKTEFINNYYAHSGLIDAATNIKHSEEEFLNSAFDDIHPLIVKMLLVSLSNLTIMMIELVGLVLNDYPLAKVDIGHNERIQQFRELNLNQFITIRTDPSYPR
jgi:hypothetical protein